MKRDLQVFATASRSFTPTGLGGSVVLAFGPAVLGVLGRSWVAATGVERWLAIAILLLALDQARMAWVDLTQIAAVKSGMASDVHPVDRRLRRFERVTWVTIGIELLGFYGAGFGPGAALGWGAALVLLSQLGFNGLAGVRLQPGADEPIQSYGVRQRWLVMVANTVGLALVGLWLAGIGRLGMALILLGMVVAYGLVKYEVFKGRRTAKDGL